MSSNDDFTATMNTEVLLNTEIAVNTELVLAHLYQAQTDLKILESWLATESQPVIRDDLLLAFGMLHAHLDAFTPSTARH